jgi:hypothetical protein
MDKSNSKEGLVVGSIVGFITLIVLLLGIWKLAELFIHAIK